MLELYYSDSCPYCRKVINYFNKQGIQYEPKDVSIKDNYNKLMKIGKISQVPFLLDTDKNISMYESDLIISYADKITLN